MSDREFDAVVLGAGQGGIPLAVNLAEAGWRVGLVERKHLGGTCVNVGCTPTKAMVASARRAWAARNSEDHGVRSGDVRVDLARIVERKDEIVRSFRRGLERRVERDGLELVRGEARFGGPGEVRADGRVLRSDRVVVNTGQRPHVPPIPGLESTPWLDSTGIMELREVPERLIVAGGGYVGCEFAQMFSRFGSNVVVLQAEDQLLPREDPDVAAAVEEAFGGEGIDVSTGAMVIGARGAPGEVSVRVEREGEESTVAGSHLLVATGRRPNTDELGLDAIGLETDERGYLPVDDRFRTEADGVWAIGDVTGLAPFTNVSYHDFQILYENWVDGSDVGRAGRHVTYAVYVDPPVAGVGLNEREAAQRDVEYVSATTPMRHVARALETGETAGLIKLLADPESRRILGASMVGIAADEVIHVVTALMDADAPWDVLERGVYAHPAVAEALPVLARKLEDGYA